MKYLIAILCALTLLPATAPAATVPMHIPTWAFDQNFAQGKDATPAQVQRYLTYAQSGLGNDKPVKDCRGAGGCSSVFYFDPGFVYDSKLCPFSGDKDFIAAAREDWYVHLPGYSDQAHRAQGVYTQNCKGVPTQVPVYEINQANPAVGAYFSAYLQRVADGWDYYMMDDTSSSLITQLYGPGGGFCKQAPEMKNGWCNKTQEYQSDADLVNAHVSFVQRLRHSNGTPMKAFYNGVSFGTNGQPRIELVRLSPQFVGALCEGCVVSGGTLRANMYGKVLDAIAIINQTPGAAFVEQNTGKSPPGSDDQIAQRLVTTSMAWLGFKDNRTIVFPNLEFNTKNLAVWPENDIYPTNPVESMSRGNADLSVAPSVWRREFSNCYLRGVPIGPCAAIVNGSSSSVTPSPSWFRLRFGHALGLSGSDALNGGTVQLSSLRAYTAIPPARAAIYLR